MDILIDPPDPKKREWNAYPPWFNNGEFIRINKKIPFPSKEDKEADLDYKFNSHSHCDKKNKLHNFFNYEHYTFAKPVDLSSFQFETFNNIDYKKKEQEILDLYVKYQQSIIGDDKYVAKIKTAETKKNNKINRLGKVLKMKKTMVYFNVDQKKIVLSWINECLKTYNKCVDLFNADSKKFDLNYSKSKLTVFKQLFGNDNKPAPYDTLTDEVRAFCSNVKGNLTAIKNKTKTHFTMSHKQLGKIYSLFIAKKSIQNEGIFRLFEAWG